MVFASLVLAGATAALAIITFFYMRHTKKMADIMVQEFNLKIAPILEVKVGSTEEESLKEYRPVISNKGFLPVHIKRIILEWWYKEQPSVKYTKQMEVDELLGRKESIKRQVTITLGEEEMRKDCFEKSKKSKFKQLLTLAEGRIYCTYLNINGREQKTGELYHLENL